MKNHKLKKILLTLILFIAILSIIGFKYLYVKEDKNSSNILYTNIAGENTQREIKNILLRSNIKKESTETFFKWINELYSRSSKPTAFNFIKSTGKAQDYNATFTFRTNYNKNNIPIPEPNCRITAYLLYKDYISTNQKLIDTNNMYLIFDIDAIDNTPKFRMNEKERKNYITLYSPISVKNTTSTDIHIKYIEEAYKNRDIQFKNDKVSLITVYLHAPDDGLRFVGHAGILIKNSGKLIFIEKFSQDAPYQATKFNNRKELKEYLLSRKDLYTDKSELPPIIMENNKEMNVNKDTFSFLIHK